jgi:hypothetical protein
MFNACRQHLRRATAENALFCDEEPCAETAPDELIEDIHRRDILQRVLRRTGTRCRDLGNLRTRGVRAERQRNAAAAAVHLQQGFRNMRISAALCSG